MQFMVTAPECPESGARDHADGSENSRPVLIQIIANASIAVAITMQTSVSGFSKRGSVECSRG